MFLIFFRHVFNALLATVVAALAFPIYQTLLAGYCSGEITPVPSSDSTILFWCAGDFLGWTSFLAVVSCVVLLKSFELFCRTACQNRKRSFALPLLSLQLARHWYHWFHWYNTWIYMVESFVNLPNYSRLETIGHNLVKFEMICDCQAYRSISNGHSCWIFSICVL